MQVLLLTYVCPSDCCNGLAGSLQVRFDKGLPPLARVLFTQRTHRREGIARALMQWAMRYAKFEGHERMTLNVLRDNAAALSLYWELGFSQSEPDALELDEPEYMTMQANLNESAFHS